MPTVQDILALKGSDIHTIRPSATAMEAIHRMNDLRVGAVLVVDEAGRLMGIFTERDVLRRVVGNDRDPAKIPVATVMTDNVIAVGPETELDDVSTIMRDHRIRHVPVRTSDGRLLGMVSIGDVNAFHVSQQQVTITQLNDYIYGRA